jgi:ATP-binding cassette, subfamily B, multidrug efflux pump
VLARSGRTLDSTVLDRGSDLSEGERQLIALTRVLAAAPTILILDEATAHIDPELETIVHRAVDTVMNGRTCFIIAHRLQTLKNCDIVLVFDKGHLVEHGSPETVLKHPIEVASDAILGASNKADLIPAGSEETENA